MTIKEPWAYRVEKNLWDIVDFIFPPICPGCQTVGSRWCKDCQQSVQPLGEKICQVCGETSQQETCQRCAQARPPYLQARSFAVFKPPIRNALHSLKYRHNIGLGQSLAATISSSVAALNWPVQAIIPIPLSDQRKRERGYNQAALIARPLSQLQGVEYLPNGLYRVRHTRSQVGLNLNERKQNLSNAFLAVPSLVTGKTILLIDDVCTTGSTLAEAARALLQAGARSVYAYTVARAISHKDA